MCFTCMYLHFILVPPPTSQWQSFWRWVSLKWSKLLHYICLDFPEEVRILSNCLVCPLLLHDGHNHTSFNLTPSHPPWHPFNWTIMPRVWEGLPNHRTPVIGCHSGPMIGSCSRRFLVVDADRELSLKIQSLCWALRTETYAAHRHTVSGAHPVCWHAYALHGQKEVKSIGCHGWFNCFILNS